MVLKSPKGIYMQLETGKIIAIRTALKVGGAQKEKPVTQNTFPQKRVMATTPLKPITGTVNAITTNSTVGGTATVTATVAAVNKTHTNIVRQRTTVGHVNFGRNNTIGEFLAPSPDTRHSGTRN